MKIALLAAVLSTPALVAAQIQARALEGIAALEASGQGAAFDGSAAAGALSLAVQAPPGPLRRSSFSTPAQERGARALDITRPSVSRGLLIAGVSGATAATIGDDADNLAPQYLIAGAAFATGMALITTGRPSKLRRVVGGVIVASALASALDGKSARGVAVAGTVYGLGEAGVSYLRK